MQHPLHKAHAMGLTELFTFTVSPWELIARGSLMYVFIYLLFRLVLRRDVGSIAIADLLVLTLVADAAQNAMAGSYNTVAEGMVLVGTVGAWNILLDWLSFQFPALRKLLEPQPLKLIEHGKVLQRNLRRELITRDELLAEPRKQGIQANSEVQHAYMESDGNISVIKFKA
jgi:uncharacterized membrane protein YcaP (DUF421 family)